jgi:hypothetical protein
MATFQKLPDEILLIVVSFLSAPDFFNFRQTNRRLGSLGQEKTVVPVVAENTIRSLDLPESLLSEAYSSVKDLTPLIPRWMATLIVDKFHDFSNCHESTQRGQYGFVPDDPGGDKARQVVKDGLCTWKELSDLSKRNPSRRSVNMPPKEARRRILLEKLALTKLWRSPQSSTESTISAIEELVYRDQAYYLSDLQQRDRLALIEAARNFRLTIFLVLQCIRTTYNQGRVRSLDWPDEAPGHIHRENKANYWNDLSRSVHDIGTPFYPTPPGYFDWHQKSRKGWDASHRLYVDGPQWQDGHDPSWVLYFLLHRGPVMFFEQWSGRKPADYVRGLMLKAWDERHEKQIAIEREYGGKLLRMAEELARSARPPYIAWYTDMWWKIRFGLPRMFDKTKRSEESQTSCGVWSERNAPNFWVFLCC